MNDEGSSPYLSAVFYTRNDGYGGKRHEAGIKGILLQAEKHHLRLELIMVEWNPPPDRPLFKDVFPWPPHLSYSTIRTIVVPASIHRRYEFSDKYPIHGTVSFNAGIRRSRGKFVLSTTPDILFSDEIMEFLASENLRTDAMYGINIHHVSADVASRPTLEEQLAECARKVLGVADIGRFAFGTAEEPALTREGPGDFILLPKERWDLIHGYPEIDVVGSNTGDMVVHMAYLSGAEDVILSDPMRIYHINHETKRDNKSKIVRLAEGIYTRYKLGKRLPRISRTAGVLLHKLSPENNLNRQGVISLSYEQYRKIMVDMINGRRYVYNDENWGLGQESLEEFIINKADWDRDYGKNQ